LFGDYDEMGLEVIEGVSVEDEIGGGGGLMDEIEVEKILKSEIFPFLIGGGDERGVELGFHGFLVVNEDTLP
jgi:hypothetical protein